MFGLRRAGLPCFLVVVWAGSSLVFSRRCAAQANPPDLSIPAASLVTLAPVPGEPVEVDVVIQRSGQCGTCSAVQLSYWDDGAGGALTCSDGVALDVPANLATQADAVVRVVLKGYPRPGSYQAWFWINCDQQIAESDLSNNKRSLPIVVESRSADGPLNPPPSDDPAQPPDDSDPSVPSDEEPPDDPDEQVLPDQPSPPADDSGDEQTGENRPPLCGLLGGQSALSAVAAPVLALLSLVGLRGRTRMRRNNSP